MKQTIVDNHIQIAIDTNAEAFCVKHAKLMHDNLIKLFPNDPTVQTEEKYTIWNIGKLALWYCLKNMEKAKLLRIERMPFKDDYVVHEDIDDLVVTMMNNGHRVHIEARTRRIDLPMTAAQAIHMDVIKPKVVYAFVFYNPITHIATIAGYGDWNMLKNRAIENATCESDIKDEKSIHASGEFMILVQDMIPIPKMFQMAGMGK